MCSSSPSGILLACYGLWKYVWTNAKAESLLIVLIFGSRISQEAFEEFVSGIDKPFFRLEEHLRGVFAFVLLWWWRRPFLPVRTRCSCWFRCARGAGALVYVAFECIFSWFPPFASISYFVCIEPFIFFHHLLPPMKANSICAQPHLCLTVVFVHFLTLGFWCLIGLTSVYLAFVLFFDQLWSFVWNSCKGFLCSKHLLVLSIWPSLFFFGP